VSFELFFALCLIHYSASDLRARARRIQDNLALIGKCCEGFSTPDVDLFIEGMAEQVEWVLVPTGAIIRGK
jgi:hypothetical protein